MGRIIADLQVHSRFSRATSKDITLKNLEKYARLKGIDLLGTGDFTHPKWIEEIRKELTDDGSGILSSKTGFKFMLQGEISNIYTQGGKGRRVHTLLLAPNIEVADQINSALLKKGRLDYDGRPIFGFSCIELVEMMKGIDKDIEIIPAHVWTPWFGLLGSNSGFDSVEECFEDQSKHIHAIETGLSSDPPMNWRVSSLDKYTLVSNSDAHSFWPWRLGRECTVFGTDFDYHQITSAIRTRKGLLETIEVDPNYGKYHFDGHRACGVVLSPKETQKQKGICPVCKKPLTIGVQYRVEQLADRPEGYTPKNPTPFRSLLPLSEIISSINGSPLASKKTWEPFMKLIGRFGSEFSVMMDAEEKQISKEVGEKIAQAVIQNRNGELKISPGYDGEYGVVQFEGNDQRKKATPVKEGKLAKSAKPIEEKVPSKKEKKPSEEDPSQRQRKSATGKKQKGLSEFF